MKARAQQAFWPLPAARRFELACWLAAAILALALTLAPDPGARAAANVTVTALPAPPLVLYRPNCIERILAHAAGKTEEAVANQITLQCRTAVSTQPSSAAGLPPLPCGRPFTVRPAPVAKRVAGCLGG